MRIPLIRRLWKVLTMVITATVLVAAIFTAGMLLIKPKGMERATEVRAVQLALDRLDLEEADFKTMIVGSVVDSTLAPEQIWAQLIDIREWTSWCALTRGETRWVEGSDWMPYSQFQHEVELGFPLGSARTIAFVEQVIPARQIVWVEQRRGARVVRVWQLDPIPNGGCRVTCVEASRSLSTAVTQLFAVGPLQRAFDETVRRLVAQSAKRAGMFSDGLIQPAADE